jgi:hypothetical protein
MKGGLQRLVCLEPEMMLGGVLGDCAVGNMNRMLGFDGALSGVKRVSRENAHVVSCVNSNAPGNETSKVRKGRE